MKIVFLDRDGVINQFPGKGKYVTKVKDFHFLSGSREAISDMTKKGYKIFVVSNQAGVGKGIMTQKKLDQITKKLIDGVNEHNGKFQKIYYSINPFVEECDCRKPNTGSIWKAVKLLKQNKRVLKDAFFIGDAQSDIQAGLNAGCQTIFVLSGRSTRIDLNSWAVKPHFIAKNLLEATKIIYAYHEEKFL